MATGFGRAASPNPSAEVQNQAPFSFPFHLPDTLLDSWRRKDSDSDKTPQALQSIKNIEFSPEVAAPTETPKKNNRYLSPNFKSLMVRTKDLGATKQIAIQNFEQAASPLRDQTISAIHTATEAASRQKSKEVSAVSTAVRKDSPTKADGQPSSVLSGQVKLKAYKNLIEAPAAHP